jgi:hypothetical protein
MFNFICARLSLLFSPQVKINHMSLLGNMLLFLRMVLLKKVVDDIFVRVYGEMFWTNKIFLIIFI